MLHWDEPEDVMNKVMMTALLAGGLMLVNSPEAAAHKEARHVYQPPAYYYFDAYRSERMPRWLRHNHSFSKWYRHSSLRRNPRIGWGELFDIYRWERRHAYRGNRQSGPLPAVHRESLLRKVVIEPHAAEHRCRRALLSSL